MEPIFLNGSKQLLLWNSFFEGRKRARNSAKTKPGIWFCKLFVSIIYLLLLRLGLRGCSLLCGSLLGCVSLCLLLHLAFFNFFELDNWLGRCRSCRLIVVGRPEQVDVILTSCSLTLLGWGLKFVITVCNYYISVFDADLDKKCKKWIKRDTRSSSNKGLRVLELNWNIAKCLKILNFC